MPPTLIGRTIPEAKVKIEAWIAGSPGGGLYRGRQTDGRAVLVSSVSTRADSEHLQKVVGIRGGEEEAELLWAGPYKDEDFRLFLTVEREPEGRPLSGLLKVGTAPGETVRLLLPLVLLAEKLAPRGIAMGLHPKVIYLCGDQPRIAHRLFTLLEESSSEWKAPILEPTLEPPERLSGPGNPRKMASIVFSLCALGVWIANGAPPYGQSLVEEGRAHFGGSPKAPALPPELQELLGPGLSRDPLKRPSLPELARKLRNFLNPLDASTQTPPLPEPLAIQALRAAAQHKLSQNGLLRLCSGVGWKAAAIQGSEGLLPQIEQGWLRLYADAAPLNGAPALDLPGPALFASLPEDFRGVELGAGSEVALRVEGESFQKLRAWGQIQQVEALIAGQSKAPLRLLREFPCWWIVLKRLPEGGEELALAPDPGGRRLAAVFTAEDSRDSFLKIAASALGPQPRVQQMTGQELFENLAALPLDGIVFNCVGPPPPKAVVLAMAEEVLRAG